MAPLAERVVNFLRQNVWCLLFLVSFSVADTVKLQHYYWPQASKLAPYSDFGAFEAIYHTQNRGWNPYNQPEVIQANNLDVAPQTGSPPATAETDKSLGFLYPPFAVLFFKSFMSANLFADIWRFALLQVVAQVLTLVLLWLTLLRLGIGQRAILIALATLGLYFLAGRSSSFAIEIGQISPFIGLILVGAACALAYQQTRLFYLFLAVGASIKLVPALLLFARKLQPVQILLWFGVPALLLNAWNPTLLWQFLTHSSALSKAYTSLSYGLTINYSLQATSFRLLGADILGMGLGLLLILASLALVVYRQILTKSTATLPARLADGPDVFLAQSALLLVALTVGTGIFWSHHVSMLAPLLVCTEAVLSMSYSIVRKAPERALAYAALAYILFCPDLLHEQASTFAGLKHWRQTLANVFSLTMVLYWTTCLLPLLRALPKRQLGLA